MQLNNLRIIKKDINGFVKYQLQTEKRIFSFFKCKYVKKYIPISINKKLIHDNKIIIHEYLKEIIK